MARLTYGFLAAAAVALISGFFIRGTSLPLLISIALSVACAALILYGNSRRLRDDDVEPDESLEEIEIAEPPAKRTRSKRAADETIALDTIDDSVFAPEPPKRKPKAKPKAAKPKAAKPKPKPAPKKPAARKAQLPKPKLAPRKKAAPRAKRVAVVPGASRYHKAACRFAQSPNVRMVTEGVAKERGYLACEVCKP